MFAEINIINPCHQVAESVLLLSSAVGLVPQRYQLDQQPGWSQDSIGYHADDGR